MLYFKDDVEKKVFAYTPEDIKIAEIILKGDKNEILLLKNSIPDRIAVYKNIAENLKNLVLVEQEDLQSLLESYRTAEDVRSERDFLLKSLDAIVGNPLRWENKSVAEKEAIKTYRQSLLDIPQQEFFPSKVIWPSLPEGVLV